MLSVRLRFERPFFACTRLSATLSGRSVAFFRCSQGVISAIALPSQLLIASSQQQLLVHGLTVLSKYGGMLLGLAVSAFLFNEPEINMIYNGQKQVGLDLISLYHAH